MKKNELYQDKNGNYLPDMQQPNPSKLKKYEPHDQQRYINVHLGANGIPEIENIETGELENSEKRLPSLYSARNECCGCTACYSICPMSGNDRPVRARRFANELPYVIDVYDRAQKKVIGYEHTGAITMLPDEEGFLYPVIDASLCIRCLKCETHCAFKESD